MCLRWFARAVAYAADRPGRVAASDFCYGLSLTGTLAILWSLGSLSLAHVAVALTASVTAATACFGTPYLRRQFALSEGPPLRTYAASWRELTRWSLLGVVLTEATANAHAYLVTFVSGPRSFALLAIGALFLRPVSLCLSALPDVERPSMARSLAGGDRVAAERYVREFRAVGFAIWMGTCLLSAAVLIWLPSMALKQNYRLGDVVLVVALWAAIMAVRLLRTPDSVLLQAAGEFRVLARTTYLSSAVSIAATLALLLALGPVASLFGILAGDSVMTAQILAAARRWRRARD
jgi:O-antigen/teichoic acid export membrane protein